MPSPNVEPTSTMTGVRALAHLLAAFLHLAKGECSVFFTSADLICQSLVKMSTRRTILSAAVILLKAAPVTTALCLWMKLASQSMHARVSMKGCLCRTTQLIRQSIVQNLARVMEITSATA